MTTSADRRRAFRRSWLVAVSAFAAALSGMRTAGAEPVWSERAIADHLDIADFAGRLAIDRIEALVAAGRALFTAKFTTADGAGRPMATQAIVPTRRKRPVDLAFRRTAGPDANACSSCHIDPVVGAAGDFVANVFVSEGFESADFDVLNAQFSNERGTNHLFGAGLIELLAREMTAELRRQREAALVEARRSGAAVTVALGSKGVSFGTLTAAPDGMVDLAAIDGVDDDLIVRPFSQKGVFTSLRQFTINAMNVHHGMQAAERFGSRWTGTDDFDGDEHPDELSAGDVTALVAFQATLPPPGRAVPDDGAWRAAAASGEARFADFGCAACHRPSLPLDSLAFSDPAPFDMAGTLRRDEVGEPTILDLALLEWAATLPRDNQGRVLVPLFGDLKRHRIADNQVDRLANELLAQRFVEREIFMTAELWGVGSTAPYGHRGDLTTLDEVIRAHGGDARASRDAYVAASDDDRSAIIAFLKTLVIAP